jgi:hypothetical protein
VTGPVGLERLPAGVSEPLHASAENLSSCAAELGIQVARGSVRPPDDAGRRRIESARLTRELLAAIQASRRAGPDRARLAAVARGIDGVVEAVEKTAWSWYRHPVPELGDVLAAIRDATRAAARAVEVLEDDDGRLAWEQRGRERETEAACLTRAARRELFGEQDDAMRALAAQDVLLYAEAWLAAVGRLRAAVARFGLD